MRTGERIIQGEDVTLAFLGDSVTEGCFEFTNGYKFDKGYESSNSAADDEGNVIRDYKSFSLDYVKDGKTISLFAEPNADITELPEGYNTVDVNGTEVYTIEAVFKFVPPDYERTEQDK